MRDLLISKVQAMWIAGLLERPLYQAVQPAPGLRRADLPVRVLAQEAGGPVEDLPEGTRIAALYDRFGGALLILGAPGAGKTTLLLELARELLGRAEADPTQPIPVVFPLSTWAAERKPLDQWLIDQLRVLYLVSQQQATAWIEQHQILPLLDGLDEVAEAHRPACVRAINTFREERGALPLVVCSRLREYESAAQEGAQLQLYGAAVVQTLRQAAVLEALAALGPEVQALRDTLSADQRSWLWKVATSPLGLSVLIPATEQDPALLWADGSDDQRRDRILGAYVDARFARRSASGQWSREETIRLLSWLAVQMQARGQTVFLLELLQPDWLPLVRQRELALFAPALVVGLSGALTGAAIGTAVGGAAVVAMALFLGLTFGLGFAVLGTPEVRRITLAERFEWSPAGAWRKLRPRLPIILSMLPSGVLAGLLFELVERLFGSLTLAAAAGLLFGLVAALLPGLVLVLGGGSVSQPIVAHQRPNQGVRESARSGIISGLLAGIITALLSGLALGGGAALFLELIGALAAQPYASTAVGLGGGLVLGALVGLAATLSKGAGAALQHGTLRLFLARAGLAPLRYADFLDHAADRELLRRVGGGWVFVHRLLLDYFASLAPGLGVPLPAQPRGEAQAESQTVS